MAEGFCPYCGRQNPPDYRFCLQCHQALPQKSPPTPPATPPTGGPAAGTPAASGGGPAEVEEPPPGAGRSWALVIVAIVIAAIALLAAVAFLPAYLQHLGAGPGSTATVRGASRDLCNQTLGVACAGNAVALPMTTGGRTTNLSTCEPVPSAGAGEELWINVSAQGALVGVVLHATAFNGPWLADPAAFQANAGERGAAAWDVHAAAGSNAAIVPVPDDGQGWCIGWWAPSGSATLTWTSDAEITYQTTG